MPQGVLPFQYEEDRTDDSVTGLAGVPLYLELMKVAGMAESISRHLEVRVDGRGWTDLEQIRSLILLNVAGGDCVDDIEVLEADRGLARVLLRLKVDELEGLDRQQRRAILRQWRKEGRRALPSPTALRSYLNEFHDAEQEEARKTSEVKAFIPEPNRPLLGLRLVNRDLVAFLQSRSPSSIATLDIDATLALCAKAQALATYKGSKGYQPLNVWWAEQSVVLHTEFRDGNVPAGYENLRVLIEALEMLPEGVEEVWLRSDTAGYEHELLRYCEEAKNERFGRIRFAIGCDVTTSFKEAVSTVPEGDWTVVRKLNSRTQRYEDTNLECAEVCFVPNEIGHSKKGPVYRYLATRERMSEQQKLPGTRVADEQQKLPFQTIVLDRQRYKLHGIVTNIAPEEFTAGRVVEWLHERCGYAEMAHSMMKGDFAGGTLPSKYFGANAAWWWMVNLSLNMTQVLKKLALGSKGATKRMKALRFSLFNLPGRVLEHARQLIIRITRGHPSFRWLLDIRKRLAALALAPG